MLRFTLSRLAQALGVILVVFTITFFLIRLTPGDPFAGEKAMPPDVRRVMEERYGLNKPLITQYFTTLGSYLRGDFQPSMKYQGMWNVKIIKDAFPISLAIGSCALVIALGLGLPAGIIAAVKKNTWMDYGSMSLALIGICLPTFVMGPMLIMTFGLKWRVFNVAGWFEKTDWVLPSLTMGLIYAAYIARLTRGGMLEVLNQDFIRTARAKGVPGSRIVMVHTLRGGLLPVVAFLGPALAGITTGSFIIEKIFNLPGLGQHFVSSVFNRDYSLILATVVLLATLLVVTNFLTDVLVAWLNPKVRLS
ncbi:MAG: ABC transporter permease subunit [Verrucomicrobiaceae bacterium]|nr:MAG: ABC transporter permease subunit [Verrucomicrobiaceae bacterium]